MQRHSDETLVAYLDGELADTERRSVEEWIEGDLEARERLLVLAATANIVRSAYDEMVNEPVPERLIAAARGPSVAGAADAAGQVVLFKGAKDRARSERAGRFTRWHIGIAAAAALAGLLIGGGAGYYGGTVVPGNGGKQPGAEAIATNGWLDNAAGDYKLLVSAGDNALIDVPASNDTREALQKISQSLPQAVRLPDLKPWGLNFRGARLVVIEGRPAAQLVYTTDNKAIGPLALIIGSSKQTDVQPTFDHRQDVNLLYWRHQGRAYVLVGQTDIGYLWGIANDIAWQLDAI
jgi:anti-sigma factor RsiW